MIRSQFQVLQSPVESNSRCVEVHSGIFISEFARVVRANRHSISKPKKDGGCRHSNVTHSSSEKVWNGVKFKADLFTMFEILDSFDNVESMTNSNGSWSDRQFNIVVGMISGLSCMVNFFEVQVWPLFADSISNSDVRLHGAIRVFLLNKVNADHPFPLVRAGLVESLEIDFFWVYLQSKEDESRGKIRVYFLNLEIHLIESLHIGFFIMNLHEVPLFIVLSQLAQ